MRKRVIYGMVLAAAVSVAGEAAAQKYPERRETRYGNKAYNAGDFEGAEVHYRRALEMNESLEEARFNMGDAAFRQEKAEEAAKIFMSFAADSMAAPSMRAWANFNAGNTMLAGQKIQEAIEFYKQALRIDPTDMQAKYNLAYAQKMLKNQPPDDQNQNQDQDKDQNQDQNQDQQDQDQQDGQGDQPKDQGEPPKSDQSGQGESKISQQDAEHMLEAMQDEEDKTREKVNAKEVPAAGRSGKNW